MVRSLCQLWVMVQEEGRQQRQHCPGGTHMRHQAMQLAVTAHSLQQWHLQRQQGTCACSSSLYAFQHSQ
jgi:hypothetical protein